MARTLYLLVCFLWIYVTVSLASPWKFRSNWPRKKPEQALTHGPAAQDRYINLGDLSNHLNMRLGPFTDEFTDVDVSKDWSHMPRKNLAEIQDVDKSEVLRNPWDDEEEVTPYLDGVESILSKPNLKRIGFQHY